MKKFRVYLYDCLYNSFSSLLHALSFSQTFKEFLSTVHNTYEKDSFNFCPSPIPEGSFSFLQWTRSIYVALVIPTSWPLSKLSSFLLRKTVPGCIWGTAPVTLRWPWSLLSNDTSLLTLRLSLVPQQCSLRASKQTATQQNLWWGWERYHQTTQTLNICRDSRKAAHLKCFIGL